MAEEDGGGAPATTRPAELELSRDLRASKLAYLRRDVDALKRAHPTRYARANRSDPRSHARDSRAEASEVRR